MQKGKRDENDIWELTNARILENARRLVGDAKLLLDQSRFASAFGLAVLGLEEVGKLMLRRWASDPQLKRDTNRYGFHKVKQAVVGSLYMARSATLAYDEFLRHRGLKLVDRDRLTADQLRSTVSLEELDEQAVEQVARALFESKGRQFLDFSELGAIDRTKQCAFFVDEDFLKLDLSPFGFKRTDAENMIEHSRDAIELSDDEMVVNVAKAIYRTSLEKG